MKKGRFIYTVRNLFSSSFCDLDDGLLAKYELDNDLVEIEKVSSDIMLWIHGKVFNEKINGEAVLNDYWLRNIMNRHYQSLLPESNKMSERRISYDLDTNFERFRARFSFGLVIEDSVMAEVHRDSKCVTLCSNDPSFVVKFYKSGTFVESFSVPRNFLDDVESEEDLVELLIKSVDGDDESDSPKVATMSQLSKLLGCTEEEAERRFDELVRVERVDAASGLNTINAFERNSK